METELKYLNDDGLEYLIQKNEANIETLKAVNAAIMEEIERRKSELQQMRGRAYPDLHKSGQG